MVKQILLFLGLIALMALGPFSQAEPCQEIHGRAILYSGDSFLEIWHVGTHHAFFFVDEKSSDLILQYFHSPESDTQALFTDFTVCPTKRFKEGSSQPVIVKRIRKAKVVVARHVQQVCSSICASIRKLTFPDGQQTSHGNAGVWKALKAIKPAFHPSHTPWKSMRGFPHYHGYGGDDFFRKPAKHDENRKQTHSDRKGRVDHALV